MRKYLVGAVIGGVLVMGLASAQGGSGGLPSPTYPPGNWVDAPMEARTDSYLAEHGYCRRGLKIRQVHNLIEDDWRTVHYHCRRP